jgi:hypothetical protein
MEFVKNYQIVTNGKKVLLPPEYTIIRTMLDGSFLVSGPRYTAGVLISLPNVVSVHEADDYVMDLSNSQATIVPGNTLTKDNVEQSENAFSVIPLVIGAAALYFLYKYIRR